MVPKANIGIRAVTFAIDHYNNLIPFLFCIKVYYKTNFSRWNGAKMPRRMLLVHFMLALADTGASPVWECLIVGASMPALVERKVKRQPVVTITALFHQGLS